MIKTKYSKDNLYLRALEKEKIQQRIKASNKIMKQIVNHSKEQIKHFQQLKHRNFYSKELVKPTKLSKSNVSDLSNHSDDSFYRKKIMQPISNRADEYEKAIQQFLGVASADVQVEKLRKIKIERKVIEKRPQSSVEFRKVDDPWTEELRKIEEKERIIQRNLKELNVKQKAKGKKRKSPERQRKDGDIFQSLEQVNKLLSSFLKNSSPQVKLKKK